MRSRIGLISIAVAGALALFVARARGDEKKTPDGTVIFSGGTVAVGEGYVWGTGTLTYKGETYRFKLDGLSYGGQVGATSATGSGSVYNLKKIEDFAGNYTALVAGATVGGGGSVTTMRNQNGVVIDSVTTSQGLKISVASQGVKITLKQ